MCTQFHKRKADSGQLISYSDVDWVRDIDAGVKMGTI